MGGFYLCLWFPIRLVQFAFVPGLYKVPFIWLAGLGGFGMMTSEALGRAAAAAAVQASLPADIASAGVEASAVAPGRFLS